MKVAVELDRNEIKKAIAKYVSQLYSVDVETDLLVLEVKSKQNYRSEWEEADCRVKATLEAVER
jgi:hypothetical protein